MLQRPTAENPPANVVDRDRWGKDQGEVAQSLLQEESGLKEFVAFRSFPEGEYLPAGSNGAWIENISVSVLTPDGAVRDYFIGWDENKTAPDGTDGYYKLSSPGVSWSQESLTRYQDDICYIRARKQLGLPLTEEQERILQEKGE
ncbi:MAG: hypothetical protein ABIB12_01135 [Patescibacteria group bacterium]